MSRSLIASLAFCLVFCHAFGAPYEDFSKREYDQLERLLNVLEAEHEREETQEPTCSIETVDDLFSYCYGRHCMYEMFDRSRYIEVVYYQNEPKIDLKVLDSSLKSLASTTGTKTPLSLTFTSGTENYKVTVTGVTPMDDDNQNISACLDLEKL